MSGGSSKTKPDKETMAIIKELMAYGKEVGQTPYMPWTGNDVAGFTDQGVQGMQQMSNIGSAFGMGGGDVASSLPATKTDASGVAGYSSYPAFREAQARIAKDSPGVAAKYASFYDMPVSELFGGAKATGSGSRWSGLGGKGAAQQPTTGGKGASQSPAMGLFGGPMSMLMGGAK